MKTILVVEDNADNLALLAGILEDEGFRIVAVSRAEDGIERLHAEPVDLIIMDVALPKMDGHEATQRIKADPATSAIPLVILTAHAMASDRETALAAGCDAFETKPIDEARLLATIRVLLR